MGLEAGGSRRVEDHANQGTPERTSCDACRRRIHGPRTCRRKGHHRAPSRLNIFHDPGFCLGYGMRSPFELFIVHPHPTTATAKARTSLLFVQFSTPSKIKKGMKN